jgi:hypothetical protein
MTEDAPDIWNDDLAAQQRRLLHDFLLEGERMVPPTTNRILASLHQGRPSALEEEQVVKHTPVTPLPLSPEFARPARIVQRQHTPSRRSNLFSLLAAAALVLVFLAVFSFLKTPSPQTSTGTTRAQTMYATSATWSSVLVSYELNGHFVIANYDPLNGHAAILASLPNTSAALESVAHNGDELLYAVYAQSKTSYILLTPSSRQVLYTVSGQGGNAIWSTDDQRVFISTPDGIVQVNVETGAASIVSPLLHPVALSLTNAYLQYYRNGYLYVFVSADGITGSLERVDLADGMVQTVTHCESTGHFWLSPYDNHLYYTCVGGNELYAVNNDGSDPRILRTQAGSVVGYAADGALMMLSATDGVFQLVKLGATPSQDQVLVNDVAPHTLIVDVVDAALAPYGNALVVKASMVNGQVLWYDNVANGTRHMIALPSAMTSIKVFGWDRLLV